MIKVNNRIQVIEHGGTAIKGLPKEGDYLTVDSHWNNDRLVRLRIGETDITVAAADLEAAIKNSRNSAKHSY